MTNKIESVRNLIKLNKEQLTLLKELENSLINEGYKYRLIEHKNPTRYSMFKNATNQQVLFFITKSYLLAKIDRYGRENINFQNINLEL